MKKTFKKCVTCGLMVTAFILVSVSIPFATNAVTTYTPLAPLPCIPSPSSTYTDSNGKTVTTPALTCAGGDLKPVTEVNVNTYIQYTFNLLIALAAVAAVFMIVWGGFLYMTSDAMQNKKDGLTKIQHAVEGLLLVLCSFLILRTINPAFVNIPVGLVTPLNLSSTNITADWMVQLDNLAATTENQTVEAIAQKTAAKAAMVAAQQTFDSAQKAETGACIAYGYSSQECNDAMNTTNLAKNKLNQTNSNYALTAATAAIKANVSTINSGGETGPNGERTFQQSTLTDLQKAGAATSRAYNAGMQGIQANGGDPAQTQALTNVDLSAKGQYLIQETLLQAQSGSMTYDRAITVVQQAQSNYSKGLANASDQTLLTNLNTTAQTALTQLQVHHAIDAGTSIENAINTASPL